MGFTEVVETGDLRLNVPKNATTNWANDIKTGAWEKISDHDHTGTPKGNQLGTGAFTDGSITSAKLATNVSANKQAATVTPTGTTQDIDWDNGNVQTMDMGSATGNITVTFSNPQDGAEYSLFTIQSATARTITWPANVKWPGGTPITLSTGNDEKDYIKFIYDGTDFNAVLTANNIS